MSSLSAERNPVECLAEEFAQRCRLGERPSLSEYTQKYPHLADEIRDAFPALGLDRVLHDLRQLRQRWGGQNASDEHDLNGNAAWGLCTGEFARAQQNADGSASDPAPQAGPPSVTEVVAQPAGMQRPSQS